MLQEWDEFTVEDEFREYESLNCSQTFRFLSKMSSGERIINLLLQARGGLGCKTYNVLTSSLL